MDIISPMVAVKTFLAPVDFPGSEVVMVIFSGLMKNTAVSPGKGAGNDIG
jgi:hypothetical protein